MASQAEKDTARAKSRQGGGQAAKDTARAKSRQNGGDGGTAERMAEREANAGLNLAGNNTTSGRGLAEPTFSQREASAGLNLDGNSTTSGRDDFYSFKPSRVQRDVEVDSGLYDLPPPVIFDTPAERELTSGLSGVEIIWSDQTETFIPLSDIMADYDGEDYWSVVFAVSGGAFTKATPTYDATQELWDDVRTDQTVYRLRVKTLNTVASPNAPTQLSAYGQYREEILCVDGDPVVNLIKIS